VDSANAPTKHLKVTPEAVKNFFDQRKEMEINNPDINQVIYDISNIPLMYL